MRTKRLSLKSHADMNAFRRDWLSGRKNPPVIVVDGDTRQFRTLKDIVEHLQAQGFEAASGKLEDNFAFLELAVLASVCVTGGDKHEKGNEQRPEQRGAQEGQNEETSEELIQQKY